MATPEDTEVLGYADDTALINGANTKKIRRKRIDE